MYFFLLQTDISFWAAFQNNPLALLIVVFGTVVVVLALTSLPKFIEKMAEIKKSDKEAEVKIKEIDSHERALLEENNSIIKSMSDVTKRIETNIHDLNKKYDKLSTNFDGLSHSVERMSKQIDVLVVYDEHQNVLDRLIALNWSLKAGKNGMLLEFGKSLILKNKNDWQWILANDKYPQLNNEKYQVSLKDIHDSVFV
jgi:nitrogen fixation/metabolism regulation signal transduction histidine kinase